MPNLRQTAGRSNHRLSSTKMYTCTSPATIAATTAMRGMTGSWHGRHRSGSAAGGGPQGAIQVRDQVRHVLDADRQADDVRAGARRQPLLVGELSVGRRGGMQDEAPG